jgi:hypothetical protein
MRPRAVALLALALCGPRPSAHAADGVAYGLRLEAGAEQDSNPARLEQVDGVAGRAVGAATALRLVAVGDLLVASGAGHQLSLAAEAAGRRFLQPEAQSEDLLVVDARAAGDLALGARTRVGAAMHHYDVFQRARALPDARDFRSSSPSLRLQQMLGPARLGLGAGWRWFVFKPERAFDFSGPSVVLHYRQGLAPALGEPGAEWDWGVAAAYEGRRFDSIRCASLLSPCPAVPPGPTRTDSFFSLTVDASRTGDALLGAGAAVQLNDSNSYGESLVRLAAHLRAVVLLPWQLSLAGRAELVGSRYADSVPVGQRMMDNMQVSYVSIEEEGRSNLRLELMRPLGRWAEAGARYTLWTSALDAGPVSYQRQTGLLFIAVALGR